MSLVQEVTAIVAKTGSATTDEVAAAMPLVGRDRVLVALCNAAKLDYVHLSSFVQIKGKRLSTYTSGANPQVPRTDWPFGRVASVWDLGQGITR